MPAAERPPKKPPKTATKGRVGSSQLRAAMYGDDPHGDQAREATAERLRSAEVAARFELGAGSEVGSG